MKLRLALSAMFALALAGTSHAIGTANEVWHQQLTTPDNYAIIQTVKLTNGDIVYVGNIAAASQRLLVFRQDIFGNNVWTRTFAKPGAPGDVFAKQVRQSPTTGDIIIASEVTGNASPRDVYLLELDQAGNSVTDRQMSFFATDSVEDMEIGVLGNVFLGVDSQSPLQPLVVKMDPTFIPLYLYAFGLFGATMNQSISDIEISPTGDALVTGVVQNGPQVDVGLDRVNFFGLPTYQKTIGDAIDPDGFSSVVDTTTGDTYLTYVRSVGTAGELARISKFDAAGAFQWNFDEPLMDRTQIAERPNGQIEFVTSDDDAPYTTVFHRMDPSGALVGSNVFAQPTLDRNLIQELKIDNDGTIFTLSAVDLVAKNGFDWMVTAVDDSGARLFQWFFDTAPGNVDVPTDIRPVGSKNVIVTGFSIVGGTSDAHAFRLAPVLGVSPVSASVLLGQLKSGNVASLESDDDNYYEVCKAFVPNLIIPPVHVQFDATVPLDYPLGDVNFGAIVKSNSPGLQANTEVWNWTTSAWEGSTLLNLSTTEAFTSVDGSIANNVQLPNRDVRARIRVSKIGFTSVSAWCLRVDQAGWRVTP